MKYLTVPMISDAAFLKLARAARKLPRVQNYYNGWISHGHWGVRIPDNILLFSINDSHRLGSGRTVKDYHHRHVLIAALSGSGIIEVDSDACQFSRGMVLFIRRFQLQDYREIQGRNFCWLFITFELPTEIEGWDGSP